MNANRIDTGPGPWAATLYTAAVLMGAVAAASFVSGESTREAQVARGPLVLLVISSALAALAGLARSEGGKRSPASALGGLVAAAVWGSLLYATY